MRPAIVLIGWYGHKNLGDDILLSVIYNILIGQGYRVILWCNKKPYIRKLCKDAEFLKPTTKLDEFGCIAVYGGGTQFFSYPGAKSEALDSSPQNHRVAK